MLAVVTGGTGFIGRALVARLEAPRVTSRNVQSAQRELPGARVFQWKSEGPFPLDALEGADVVFHLAGEPVAEGRLTAEKKHRIWASRVDGTRALVEAMRQATHRPKVLVSASAVGFYGDRGDETLEEDSARGSGYLSDVCVAWEREALAAEALGVRVAIGRVGIVLDPRGGALKKMLPPFRLGVGATLGSGDQWMPWIHLSDVVDAFMELATNERASGVFNLTSPHPVTQRVFAGALADALGRPLFLRAPAWALKVALGELAGVLLASQRAVPSALTALGHKFRFAHLEEALREAVGS